jgi:hypothetical protein
LTRTTKPDWVDKAHCRQHAQEQAQRHDTQRHHQRNLEHLPQIELVDREGVPLGDAGLWQPAAEP